MQHGEAMVGRGHAAPGVRAVHDVVVDEGARLEELQGRGCAQGLLGVGTSGAAVPPPAEGGTQALAPAEQVADGLHQRVEIIADAVEDVALRRDEVVDGLLHPGAQVVDIQR